MIRAVIFDLDNCLSAADAPGKALFEPAFAAIRAANHGALTEAALERAFADCWFHALDFVARKHGFSAGMLEAGWRVFSTVEVGATMRGYDDLDALAAIRAPCFLVTSGFRRLQESKIAALGIGRLFAGVYIDALDDPARKGKQQIFAEILRERRLLPIEALVVGDNADSEIEAGNRLGIPTAQILRPGVARAANATHHIRALDEIHALAK